MARLPEPRRLALTPNIAEAFAAAFWVALGLMALAPLPALLLPGAPHRHPAIADADEVGA